MQVRWVATFSSILGATLESMFTEWWTLTICSVHTDVFFFFVCFFDAWLILRVFISLAAASAYHTDVYIQTIRNCVDVVGLVPDT